MNPPRNTPGLLTDPPESRITLPTFDRTARAHPQPPPEAPAPDALEPSQTQETLYDDFPAVVATRLAVTDAMRETGTDRMVIVQGPSGSGKSAIGKCLKARWPKSICAEADPTWTYSLHVMLSDWILAIDAAGRPNQGDLADTEKPNIPFDICARKSKIMESLRARKSILIIEEAQLLGIPGLDFIKAIINQTPVVVVLLALGTLMQKLETRAYEQTRQLTLNRLKERIELPAPDAKWILEFMKRRGVTFADHRASETCAQSLASNAKLYGRWKFVNQVTARILRSGPGENIATAQFLAAQQAVINTR